MVTVDNGVVEFSFFRPNAQAVYLAGEFNEWRTDQLAMMRGEGGYWHLRLKMAPGDFKFRYRADGVWYTDFAAFGVEPGRFGLDSVVHVSERKLTLAKPVEQPGVRKFTVVAPSERADKVAA